MASAREERSQSRRKELARARVAYRAHLAWLEGYPLASGGGVLEWQCLPLRGELARVRIGPMELSRARRAHHHLAHEVGEAACRAEGLPPLARLEAALVLAGRVARSGLDAGSPLALLPARAAALVRPLSGSEPAVVAALSWLAYVTGVEQQLLAWLTRHGSQVRGALEALGEDRGVRLIALLARHAEEAGDAAGGVLGLVAHPDACVCTVPAPKDAAPEPTACMAHHLAALVEHLAPQPGAQWRRTLRLALDVAPLGWVARWRAYWTDLAAWRARPVPRGSKQQSPPTAPSALHCDALFEAVRSEGERDDATGDALAELLRALPRAPPGLRERGLLVLGAMAREPETRRPGALLRALTALVRSDGRALPFLVRVARLDERALGRALAPGTWLVIDGLPPPLEARGCLEAMLELEALFPAAHFPVVLEVVVQLLRLGTSPPVAVSLAREAAPLLEGVSRWQLGRAAVELAARLSGNEAARFARLLGPLLAATRLHEPGVRPLLAWFETHDALPALCREIEEGKTDAIARFTEIASSLAPRGAPPAAAPDTSWVRHYPKSLRDALLALAALPDAERRAARLLRTVAPRREALERELATVRERLLERPSRALEARAASLAARAAAGPRPGKAAILRMRDKLARAADRGRLERVAAAIDDALFDSCALQLGTSTRPDWWRRPEAPALVAAISALPAAERRLGFELLRARGGPPPWLPWDDARNQAFLARLRGLGLRIEPWLGTAERTVETAKHRLRLSLELDPLEILLMGQHFSTCLALQGCNFYAAVVNAVDVNKRVFYARLPDGTVAGRCLLALTETGRLLTFHVYAHDHTLGLEQVVARHVSALASEMGTCVVPRGVVPTLLASRWYDDGAEDLTGRLAALTEGSPVREQLRTLTPQAAVAGLEAALAPLGLDESTLPQVLALEEIQARPELAVALAPHLARSAHIPWECRRSCAELALRAGERDAARAVLLGPGLWQWLVRPCPECRAGCYPNLEATLHLLPEVDPSLALRALRHSRLRNRPRLEDEQGQRRLHAARALAALGRRGQARRLLELDVPDELRKEYAAALATLGVARAS